MRELPLEDLHRRLEEFYARDDIPIEIVAISREKMQTLADFWDLAGPLIDPPAEPQEKAWQQWGRSQHLRPARECLAGAPAWDATALETILRDL